MTLGAVYEIMMVEWGLDPIAIVDRWTDEMMDLMLDKLIDRKKQESEAIESASSGNGSSRDNVQYMSTVDFAKKIKEKLENKGK